MFVLLIQLLLVSSSISLVVSSTFQPRLLWKHTIPGGGPLAGTGFRKGNGIVVSSDDNHLFATDEDGSLHMVDLTSTNDGTTTFNHNDIISSIYRPPVTKDHTTECRSSVSVFESENNGVRYVVYTVIDVPKKSGANVSSRVIAINVNKKNKKLGSVRWKRTIDGVAIGTPLISHDGTAVFASYNRNNRGSIVALNDAENGIVQKMSPVHDKPFGPIQLRKINGKEYLFVCESSNLGYAREGRVHFLDVTLFENFVPGQKFAGSSLVSPVLSPDFERMFVSAASSTIHGWTNGNFNSKPKWTTKLPISLRNSSFPIVNHVTPSDDGNRIYVASASNTFHCLDANDGSEIWSYHNGNENIGSVYLTEAQYCHLTDVVYSIEHMDGKISQFNAATGDINWQLSCNNITGNDLCQDSVEGGFSLSKDCTTLLYGDIFGTINAVRVSDYNSNTDSPTQMPTSDPTSRPTKVPTAKPSKRPTPRPTKRPTPKPTRKRTRKPTEKPTVPPPETKKPTSNPTPEKETETPTTKQPRNLPSDSPSIAESPILLPLLPLSAVPSVAPSPPVAHISNAPTKNSSQETKDDDLKSSPRSSPRSSLPSNSLGMFSFDDDVLDSSRSYICDTVYIYIPVMVATLVAMYEIY